MKILYQLTQLLYLHYGVKPWLLIDEYDTPIQSAYLHGYYQPMIELMRGLFGSALKGQSSYSSSSDYRHFTDCQRKFIFRGQ